MPQQYKAYALVDLRQNTTFIHGVSSLRMSATSLKFQTLSDPLAPLHEALFYLTVVKFDLHQLGCVLDDQNDPT